MLQLEKVKPKKRVWFSRLTFFMEITGPPPILGYLGDSASEIRRALLDLLNNSSDQEVRIAILRLIGAAVDHQPGLAETLLTTPEGGDSTSGKKSAVQIIMVRASEFVFF